MFFSSTISIRRGSPNNSRMDSRHAFPPLPRRAHAIIVIFDRFLLNKQRTTTSNQQLTSAEIENLVRERVSEELNRLRMQEKKVYEIYKRFEGQSAEELKYSGTSVIIDGDIEELTAKIKRYR